MNTGSFADQIENEDADFLDFDDLEEDSRLDVTCPGCAARLNNEPLFSKYRICPNCTRHFWMPARERLDLLADPGSFRETNAELVSVDPLVFRDALPLPDRVAEIRDASSYPIRESLVTGTARIGGQEAVLVVLDFALLGDEIGVVAGEKMVLAIELATSRRLTLIAACAAGAHRAGASMLSLVQSVRIANSVAKLQRNGVAFIGMLSHPAAGAVFSGFASHANLLFAEPGSQIGMSIARSIGSPLDAQPGTESAEQLLSHGMLDGIIDRRNVRDHLVTLLDVLTSRAAPRVAASAEATSIAMLSSAREVSTARHPERPTSSDYVQRLMPGFVELHGDRTGFDDPQVRIGLGQLDGVSLGVVCVNREAGNPPPGERTPPAGAGYRKATRLYRLAALLEMPVVTLIDGLEPQIDEGASGAEIGASQALLARTVATVPVPTISVILGEVSGPHAMTYAVADRALMFEHAVFCTSNPDIGQSSGAGIWSTAMPVVLTSRDCRRFGLVDSVIPEPGSGAHENPASAAQYARLAISRSLGELAGLGPRRLQDERSRKYRQIGLAGAGGPEAVRLEIAQLLELQRSVGRSIDDLRDRIEMHHLTRPSLPHLPPRPGMPVIPISMRPNLPSIRRPVVNRAEIAELAGRLASTGREFAERVNDVRTNLTSPDLTAEPPAQEHEPEPE